MKIFTRCLSACLAVVALAVAVTGIYMALSWKDEEPVLVEPSQEALTTASVLMNLVCKGDYETASNLILGKPDLGVDREAEDAVGRLLWDAYQESMRYEVVGECYATENGLAQQFTVRYLDVDSVTLSLGDRAAAILEARVEAATDMTEIYDGSNEFREDVVMDALLEAAAEALEGEVSYISQTFTMNLVYSNGSWYAVPDKGLLSAISGSLAG